MSKATVLSIGQCGSDDSRLARVLSALGATLERAGDGTEARDKLAAQSYDLVLVNRVFDADGASGIDLIRQLKVEECLRTPVMLVSNYADAQTAAEEAGACPGFGKSQLSEPETLQRIQTALTAPAPPTNP